MFINFAFTFVWITPRKCQLTITCTSLTSLKCNELYISLKSLIRIFTSNWLLQTKISNELNIKMYSVWLLCTIKLFYCHLSETLTTFDNIRSMYQCQFSRKTLILTLAQKFYSNFLCLSLIVSYFFVFARKGS